MIIETGKGREAAIEDAKGSFILDEIDHVT
jgi:hypothetical protein